MTMNTKYTNPTVESTMGNSDDEEREEVRKAEEGSANESAHRHSKPLNDSVMIVNSRKERRRRKHRSGEGSKYNKSRIKSEGRRLSGTSTRDNGSENSRYRHRRSLSHRSTGSTSSSDDDEPIPDHRAVLAAARARLTSPSMMSTFTTQTTATNTSSSSSGSNSTVTQMSIAKRASLGKRPAGEAPLSPAVPDPPDVFTFIDGESHRSVEDEEDFGQEEHEEHEEENNQQGVVEERRSSDDEEEEEEEGSDKESPQWTQKQIEAPPAEDISHIPSEHRDSASSSASSSFHGDDFSDPPADNDTDRSTSPERSVKGHETEPRPLETILEIPEAPLPPASPPLTPSSANSDRASARMASQMAAAREQQKLHGTMNQFGTPNMPRGNAQLPVIPPSALSARYPQHISQRPLPRAEKLPVTGYELLASQLSTRADIEDGTRIKPLYRKFEALNHRLLLHLQDELSELEEQLHRLDHADTQSRRTDRHIIPASRRGAAMAGGELQWHKTDVLGRIGFKLAQYNQALTSFNETQLLAPPTIDDIDQYREYLEVEQPIHESETHFLDPEDDLVSLSSQPIHHKSPDRRNQSSSSEVSSSDVSSQQLPPPPPNTNSNTTPSTSPKPSDHIAQPLSNSNSKDNLQSIFPALAAAIATSVLLPVLTFTVIPGFIGRLTVTLLVGLFTILALLQAGILSRQVLLGREALSCVGIYAGVMSVLAGIMS